MTDVCQHFRESILELVYDELSPEQAKELRLHASACSSCREQLNEIELTRKLAAQLPLLEPNADTDNGILELAERAAVDLRHEGLQASTPEIAGEPDRAGIAREPGLMERLRSLLLAPAFATAAVAALVFVISFFLVERATPGGDSPAAVEKVPFFGPAVPFEERAVATEAEALEIPEAPGESEPVLAALPESEIAKSRESGAAPRTRRSSERRGRGPTDLSTRLRGKGGAIDYLLGDSPPKKSVGKRKKEVTTTAKPSTVLNRENGADPFPSADDESSGESPESKSRKIGASAELAEDADFQQGLDAYDKGDCDAANTALLRTVKSRFAVPTQKAIALHHLARCEKRSGRFGKALPWYDQLLSGYPTYSRRPEALWEAVVCHRRLGHLDRAGALLNELQRFPSWKDRASQEILRLGLEPQ